MTVIDVHTEVLCKAIRGDHSPEQSEAAKEVAYQKLRGIAESSSSLIDMERENHVTSVHAYDAMSPTIPHQSV